MIKWFGIIWFYISNIPLFIEWCKTGHKPQNFIYCRMGKITPEDIGWAKRELQRLNGAKEREALC